MNPVMNWTLPVVALTLSPAPASRFHLTAHCENCAHTKFAVEHMMKKVAVLDYTKVIYVYLVTQIHSETFEVRTTPRINAY